MFAWTPCRAGCSPWPNTNPSPSCARPCDHSPSATPRLGTAVTPAEGSAAPSAAGPLQPGEAAGTLAAPHVTLNEHDPHFSYDFSVDSARHCQAQGNSWLRPVREWLPVLASALDAKPPGRSSSNSFSVIAQPSQAADTEFFHGAARDRVPLLGLTATPFRGTNEEETRRLIARCGGRRLVIAPSRHFATVTIRPPFWNPPTTHVQSPDPNLMGWDVIWQREPVRGCDRLDVAAVRVGLAGPSGPFYGFNRPGAKSSEAIIENWWRQGMTGGAKAHYDGIVAFSQTDFTEDLKKITVPVLVMHGDDDQIVPYADS